MNIEQALQWGVEQLTGGESPRVDVKMLLSDCIQQNQTYLYTWPEKSLTTEQITRFKHSIARRKQGEPVAYILGYKAFWGLNLSVSTATLIPRPETELLVEEILRRVSSQHARVCDLGTGTGAIALALASERPDWSILGVDKIDGAIQLARRNAELNNLTQVNWAVSDWFSSLTGQCFDIIVSNPPYVESQSEYLQQGDVVFEPDSALTSGEDGLDDIRFIIENASDYLAKEGYLVIEHGFNQQSAIMVLLDSHGYTQCEGLNDLNNLPRLTIARKR